MRLKNRIALITGGSRGIGAAVAKAYAAEGAHLILVARKSSSLEKIDDELQALGHEPSTLVALDMNNFTGIYEMAASLMKRFGKLDILVANAGIIGTPGPLAHSDEKIWEEVIRVNVIANYHLFKAFDPLLKQSDAGRAIVTSSVMDHLVEAYYSAYCTSKAAVTMLARSYAEEVKNSKVRVNVIGPHATDTDMLHENFPGGIPSYHVKPEDIASLFVKLADPSFTENGQAFYLDKGQKA